METNIVKLLVLVMSLNAAASQRCPGGCTCRSNVINCLRLTSFPDLSGTTEGFLTIYQSTLQEIPANAFNANPDLTSITIYDSTINRIRNCAFKGLRDTRFISIYQSSIETIETGAFNDITFDEGTTSIYSVRIDTIEPYAFSSLVNGKSFSIYEANITTVKPFAFHNLTIDTFSIYNANIADLQTFAFSDFVGVKDVNFYRSNVRSLKCDTLNKLNVDADTRININNIDLVCDCNIAWLLASGMASTLQPSVTCSGPPALANREIRNLNATVVCPSGNFSRTCPTPSEDAPGPCSETPAADSHRNLSSLLLLTVMLILVSM